MTDNRDYRNEVDNEECETIAVYTGNMPCDTTGYCAGTACPMFFKCQG